MDRMRRANGIWAERDRALSRLSAALVERDRAIMAGDEDAREAAEEEAYALMHEALDLDAEYACDLDAVRAKVG